MSQLIKEAKAEASQFSLSKENGSVGKSKQPQVTLLNQYTPMSFINNSNVDMSISSDTTAATSKPQNSTVAEIISCYSNLKDPK